MVAFVPPTTFPWVFKGAVVKGHCEHLVNGTPGYLFTALFSAWPRAKAPLVIGEFENLLWGIAAGQHQVPHASYKRIAFRVVDHIDFTGEPDFIAQITPVSYTHLRAHET